jgi:hypothetical protein
MVTIGEIIIPYIPNESITNLRASRIDRLEKVWLNTKL